MTTGIITGIDNFLQEGFNSPVIETAMNYAIRCHQDTNHTYNGKPYYIHLKMVYDYGCRFASLLPAHQTDIALAACWVHDTIEDCRQTYNDVGNVLGKDIAEIAFALTNEKGRSREERANEKFYAGIKNAPPATFVKICDRLANAYYSMHHNSRMAAVYYRELGQFREKLWTEELRPMFEELELILTD